MTGLALVLLGLLTAAAAQPDALPASPAAADVASAGPQPLSRVAGTFARTFRGQNGWWLAGGAAGALLAHPADRGLQAWWRDRRPPQGVLRTADILGDFEFQVPAVLAFWGAGKLARSKRLAATGAAMAEGYLAAKAITMAMKAAVRRQRPDGSNRLSFPSGHASGSFALAAVIACRHGPRAGLPFLALAAFTAAMRTAQQKHYLSDVVAGAAIGVAVGRAAAGVGRPQASGPRVQCLPMPAYPLAVRLCW